MENEEQDQDEPLEPAAFSERCVAFFVDAALFVAGYLLSFRLAFPRFPFTIPKAAFYWQPLWLLLFLAYLSVYYFMSRPTLGKRLLGLRVAARKVVRPGPYSGGRKFLARAGAAFGVLALACFVMWKAVWEPRYDRIMMMAYAEVGLHEMAQLQAEYKRANGRYADNIFDLAKVSLDPRRFLGDMINLVDLDSLSFQNSAEGFVITARARDARSSVVSVKGP